MALKSYEQFLLEREEILEEGGFYKKASGRKIDGVWEYLKGYRKMTKAEIESLENAMENAEPFAQIDGGRNLVFLFYKIGDKVAYTETVGENQGISWNPISPNEVVKQIKAL